MKIISKLLVHNLQYYYYRFFLENIVPFSIFFVCLKKKLIPFSTLL